MINPTQLMGWIVASKMNDYKIWGSSGWWIRCFTQCHKWKYTIKKSRWKHISFHQWLCLIPWWLRFYFLIAYTNYVLRFNYLPKFNLHTWIAMSSTIGLSLVNLKLKFKLLAQFILTFEGKILLLVDLIWIFEHFTFVLANLTNLHCTGI